MHAERFTSDASLNSCAGGCLRDVAVGGTFQDGTADFLLKPGRRAPSRARSPVQDGIGDFPFETRAARAVSLAITCPGRIP